MTSTDRPEVILHIPADTRFVALARTAASAMATEFDFDIDEIDELRIGIDEMVTILIETRPSDDCIHLTMSSDDTTFTASGSVESPETKPAIDELTSMILAAVVDDFELAGASFSLTKTRTTTKTRSTETRPTKAASVSDASSKRQ